MRLGLTLSLGQWRKVVAKGLGPGEVPPVIDAAGVTLGLMGGSHNRVVITSVDGPYQDTSSASVSFTGGSYYRVVITSVDGPYQDTSSASVSFTGGSYNAV